MQLHHGTVGAFLILGLISLQPHALKAQTSYPESALREAYENELNEKMKMEELERKLVREQADYERRINEVEQQVQAKQLQAEGYKLKSEQLISDLETMNASLFDMRANAQATDEEIKASEEHFLKVQGDYEALVTEHKNAKLNLEKKQDELSNLKQKLELSIAKSKIETEKMRQDLSVIEAEIAAADAKRADLESSEMQVRVEWLAVKKESQDKRDLKAKYQFEAEESKRKLSLAKQELAKSQNELSKISAETSKQAQASKVEVQKYEKEMVDLAQKKALAEAEKIRLKTEQEKLTAYVDQIKGMRNDNRKSLEETQSALIQSRLALESVKTDLTRSLADNQKSEFDNQKLESRIRGLASAAEASEILDGGRLFVMTKKCPSYRRPASQSPEAYQVEEGQKLLARESIGNWVKLTSEGQSVYVDKQCGKFEEK